MSSIDSTPLTYLCRESMILCTCYEYPHQTQACPLDIKKRRTK